MKFIIYQQDNDRGAPEIRVDSSIAILSDNLQVALIGNKSEERLLEIPYSPCTNLRQICDC